VKKYLVKPFIVPNRPADYTAQLNRTVNICRGFAQTIRRGQTRWLIIDGDNGSGKTHLACHLTAAAYIENIRLNVAWITESDWLSWSYRAARPVSSDEDEAVERAREKIDELLRADLILVDEWLSATGGYTVVGGQHLNRLFKLSEERPKTLVFTSNVPLPTAASDKLTCKDDPSVPVLDGRIVDRLYEYAIRLEMPLAPAEVNHRVRARRRHEALKAEWAKGSC
jgi:DNA replication protein DnaC